MNSILKIALSAVFVSISFGAHAQSSVPNPNYTPGAINPMVTQENISQTICVRGWTKTIRTDMGYTESLKRQQIVAFGYGDRNLRDYEEDHLIPLELGGAPTDQRNLWPEPRMPSDNWTSDMKDHLENVLKHLVCRGAISLNEARMAIATDWRSAYQRFVRN